MSKWPMVPLGKVLRQYKDYVNAPEPRTYPKLSVKLYGRGVTLDSPTDGTALKMKRHQIAKAGQVILSEIWGKKGAIGFVPDDGAGALCTSHFFLFDVDHDRLLPRWLDYVFRANFLQAQLDSEAKGTTGYAAVRPAHLAKATIPLPPLAEQWRLVGRIDALAAKIEEAKGLRASLVREMEFLPRAAMSQVFSAIIAEAVPLHEVCTAIVDCLHSNPVYAETGVPTVRSPDVGWGELMLDSARRTSEAEYGRRTARGEPAPGDIVVVREGGGTGKAGIVLPGQRFSLGQRVMMLRPDPNRIDPQYLLYYWLSPLVFDDHIVGRMKGSASPHLNIGAAREFPIRIPALSRQRQIVEYLDKVQARLRRLNDGQDVISQEIDALLPAILDRAFRSGL